MVNANTMIKKRSNLVLGTNQPSRIAQGQTGLQNPQKIMQINRKIEITINLPTPYISLVTV